MTQPASKRLVTEAALADELTTLETSVTAQIPGELVTVDRLPGTLDNTTSGNGVPFTQDNVTTHNGVQYAVWSNDQRHPIIGRRTLPHGPWSTFDLSTVSGNPLASPTVADGHNNYVVAVDSEGRIHVAGNHHESALRYIRSTAAGDITAWTAPSMVGDAIEGSLTYPQFLRMPNGELLFVARTGSSGNGSVIINAYNTTTDLWARRSKPLSGLAADGVTPDESPYTNHLAVGADGTLHLFYLWRITDDVATTHDICHIKSGDNGATFTNAAGTPLTLPVTPTTSPKILAGAHPVVQAINQSGATVDSLGRPHAVWWMVGAGPDYYSELHHFWHDGSTWHNDILIARRFYVAPLDMARVALLSYGGRTLLIYSPETNTHRTLWMREITPAATAPLPTFQLLDVDLGAYEPSYDTRAVTERGELHMLVTPIQAGGAGIGGPVDPAFAALWGEILSLDLDRITEVAAAAALPALTEKRWVPAIEFLASAGSPTLNATANGVPSWQMDTAATEVIAATAMIPTTWERFDVVMWWANMGAGAGDIAANLRYANRAVGDAVNGGETNVGDVILTAGAQNVVTLSTLATGLYAIPGRLFRFNFRRSVGNAADTLGNDMGVIAFELRRTA